MPGRVPAEDRRLYRESEPVATAGTPLLFQSARYFRTFKLEGLDPVLDRASDHRHLVCEDFLSHVLRRSGECGRYCSIGTCQSKSYTIRHLIAFVLAPVSYTHLRAHETR